MNTTFICMVLILETPLIAQIGWIFFTSKKLMMLLLVENIIRFDDHSRSANKIMIRPLGLFVFVLNMDTCHKHVPGKVNMSSLMCYIAFNLLMNEEADAVKRFIPAT